MESLRTKSPTIETNHYHQNKPQQTKNRAFYRSSKIDQRLNMYLTIDTKNVTLLRSLIMNAFAEIVSFMKIEPVDHARKMKVCLCLLKPVETHVMSAIMRSLPSAEFGRFVPLS